MLNIFKQKSSNIKIETKSIAIDLLEEKMCEVDIPYEYVENIIKELNPIVSYITLYKLFHSYFRSIELNKESNHHLVDLIIGINGAGKTTTIAKLANLKKDSVMLCAGDTFRAAAIEQIKTWGKRLNIPVISSKIGHDPSAIVYDACISAKSKNIKNLIIDTAGRLHTNVNLLNELIKIKNVIEKTLDKVKLKKTLIIDGTQANSAINQAKIFKEKIGIDSIIITKLDGTANGGALLIVAKELNIPITYIGTGENINDIIEFDTDIYIKNILSKIFE